jgi:hypothetical protein
VVRTNRPLEAHCIKWFKLLKPQSMHLPESSKQYSSDKAAVNLRRENLPSCPMANCGSLSQKQWIKTTPTFYRTVLEARCLTQGQEALEKNLFLTCP